jgi:hypothetical protein
MDTACSFKIFLWGELSAQYIKNKYGSPTKANRVYYKHGAISSFDIIFLGNI